MTDKHRKNNSFESGGAISSSSSLNSRGSSTTRHNAGNQDIPHVSIDDTDSGRESRSPRRFQKQISPFRSPRLGFLNNLHSPKLKTKFEPAYHELEDQDDGNDNDVSRTMPTLRIDTEYSETGSNPFLVADEQPKSPSGSFLHSPILENAQSSDVLNTGLELALGERLGKGAWLPTAENADETQDQDFTNYQEHSIPDDGSQAQKYDQSSSLSPYENIEMASLNSKLSNIETRVESNSSKPSSPKLDTSPKKVTSAVRRLSLRVSGKDDLEESQNMRTSGDMPQIYLSDTSDSNDYLQPAVSKSDFLSVHPESTRGSFLPTDGKQDGLSSIGSAKEEVQKHEDEHEEICLFGSTLRLFDNDSRVRQRCAKIVMHKYFDPVVVFLIFLVTVLLSYQLWIPEVRGYHHAEEYTSVDWVLVFIYVLFTIETVLKIITFGLVDDSQMYEALNITMKTNQFWLFWDRWDWKKLQFKSQTSSYRKTMSEPSEKFSHSSTKLNRAYLRVSWNRIDFVSVFAFWISLFLSINHYDLRNGIFIFRSLMCLKILRLVNLTHGTFTILKALKEAIPELIDVILFLVCFWSFFAILGVQCFKASFRRQCVWTNPADPTDTFVNEMQFCGSYLDNGRTMPYIYSNGESSGIAKGYRCPQNSVCVSDVNPYGGVLSFDNIAHSFEIVFVIMSANTFTDLMYYVIDSENLAASLFFIVTLFTLTVWLVNLIIAVIVHSFMRIKDNIKAQNKSRNADRLLISKTCKKQHETYSKTKRILYYSKFEPLFCLLIVCNIAIRAKFDNASIVYRFDCAVTIVLLLEIIARFCIFLPKWRIFFYSYANVIDLLLAVITALIIIPPIRTNLNIAYDWLSFFFLFRIYRVVMMISYIKMTWYRIIVNLQSIIDLSIFYFVLLFLVSIIVTRLTEGILPEEEIEENMLTLYNLPNSFISLYIITTTEDWTSILYLVQQYSPNTSTAVFVACYLIFWFFFSNMLIFNIFIAVIAKSLEVSEMDKRKLQITSFYNKLKRHLNEQKYTGLLSSFKRKFTKKSDYKDKEEFDEALLLLLLNGKLNEYLMVNAAQKPESNRIYNYISKFSFVQKIEKFLTSCFQNPFYNFDSFHNGYKKRDDLTFAEASQFLMDQKQLLANERTKYLKENPFYNTSLYIFAPNNKLRMKCQRIVRPTNGKRIEGVQPNEKLKDTFLFVSFLVTIMMVVSVCIVTPLYRREYAFYSSDWGWPTYLDCAFTIFFTLEFIVSVIADGLAFTPHAYLRSPWNCIDAAVLITLWINFISELQHSGPASRVVNGFRALRAFRLLTLSSTAKETFQNTMISGFWKILNAAVVSMTLLVPFSIWGMSIFKHRLGYCNDEESTMAECMDEFANEVFNWEVLSPRVYVEPPLYLDDFVTSFKSLYEIISLEGWVDLLEDVMNITGLGLPPSHFADPFNGLFVVLFNFCSTVFILTLFVSVIISNYSKNTGTAYLTEEQKSWYEIEKVLGTVKPSKRRDASRFGPVTRWSYRLVVERNVYWKAFLNTCLFVHTIALFCEIYPSPAMLNDFRYAAYLICSIAFTINVILTMVAIGPKDFFTSRWNLFKTVVVIGALLTSAIAYDLPRNTVFANINKLFLISLLFFVIPRSDRLNQLLKFASASLPALLSLAYTWGVLFLVYAIAMNQIFGLTRTNENSSNNVNFRTVPKALILLFRMSFGEGWNYVMNDFAVEAPFCFYSSNVYDSDCGSKSYAYFLFMTWNILSMYIFVNMFISLVVDSFSYVYRSSGPLSNVTRGELRLFKQAWLPFDQRGTGYISEERLMSFLRKPKGVFSYHIYDERYSVTTLSKRWFVQHNASDPYDVFIDYGAMSTDITHLSQMRLKTQNRIQTYERMVEYFRLINRRNNFKGIDFTSTIRRLALVTLFEESSCLKLEDFLTHFMTNQKCDLAIKEKRVIETLKMVICRWKFKMKDYDALRSMVLEDELNTAFIKQEFIPTESENPFEETESNKLQGEYPKPDIQAQPYPKFDYHNTFDRYDPYNYASYGYRGDEHGFSQDIRLRNLTTSNDETTVNPFVHTSVEADENDSDKKTTTSVKETELASRTSSSST
ncbi:Calcium-channel protein [Komagataella phaffii CBS 7435]|uniref:Calcium-channel protein CCH1 n=2 Tax=Komagataella phaffii TaxID=460519 RepID=C4R091_KOMPG|nr:Voltage-gated high-affinity calcium channel [Komagataella phaffii GS115]AOA62126.1 GQ67_00336T0 [Komagataella phaffii]CAH2448580.1 Calcium-channel protein [Komagataella phaffii CBS 7435]AOA67782.1 GQ68_01053T0 [Komagataella phaffii GS115]CAY68915.1 Voltage-gated high-affinity calcium channel [Komagataella phaffii GS115]CCA38681.1 Calcium-channel protein [Komagataella phaffii CBS 7435]